VAHQYHRPATTVSPGQRLYLIHTRDALLDELAHRDPDGFTRWLHSDTRTVNDPAPFLTTTAPTSGRAMTANPAP